MAIASHQRTAVWRDYVALAKPRVVLLHLLTAAAAMFLAAGGMPSLTLMVFTLLGGGLVAGASNVLNCYFDRDIDSLMLRTRGRPLPDGRLSPYQALVFGTIVSVAGVYLLSQMVSWITALLAVGALAYYLLIYTLWLKRKTYWGSIIGSGAGAFPPLIGWIAVTGRVEVTPFLLFSIIALWTPPHFWSLALSRRRDYALAGLGMIPSRNTGRWITVFSLALAAVSILVVRTAGLGGIYLGSAGLLGITLLVMAVRSQLKEDSNRPRQLYWFSIIYLVFLFGAMLIDRLVF
jgi:heme o synthase